MGLSKFPQRVTLVFKQKQYQTEDIHLFDETKFKSGWSWVSFKRISKVHVGIAHSSIKREGILANRLRILQSHSFIHSFTQWYFLNAWCILDAILGAKDPAVTKIYNNPTLKELLSWRDFFPERILDGGFNYLCLMPVSIWVTGGLLIWTHVDLLTIWL